jgi:hypothetical protein
VLFSRLRQRVFGWLTGVFSPDTSVTAGYIM